MFAKKIWTVLLSGVFLASISPVIDHSTLAYAAETAEISRPSDFFKGSTMDVFGDVPFDGQLRAVALPNDPLILPLDKVFQVPVGTSTKILEGGKLLQLNPASKSQKGAIWSKRKISLLSDFTFKSYLYLGNEKADAADGMTFTLTNDPRMTTSPEQVIGSPGMGIGSYSTRSGQPYIRNAISIEFDTYLNNGSDRMDREIGNHKEGHIAFVTPKPNNNNASGEHSGITLAPTYLSDGSWRTLTVHWDASNKTLSYDVSGIGRNSHVISDLNKQFGGTSVYWGFTSSTGGKYQENALAITQLPTNIESQADVAVNDGPFSKSVEANNGDKVTLKNSLYLKGSFLDSKNPKTTINLPSELAYVPNSIVIDGKKVPDNAVTHEGQQLIINLSKYVTSGETLVIQLDTKLKDATPEQILSLDFDYWEDDLKLQTSNEVTVKVAKVQEKELTVYYKDLTGETDLSPSKVIKGQIGTGYKEDPIDIPGYVFDHDSGNTSGNYAENSGDIYFYYRVGEFYFKEVPKTIDFGSYQVSNRPLNIFGKASGKLLIFDERSNSSSGWTLQLSQPEPFTMDGGDIQIANILSFVDEKGNAMKLSEAAVNILTSRQKGLSDETSLLDNVESKPNKGIRADVPVEDQRVGTFQGKLKWSLLNAPENN